MDLRKDGLQKGNEEFVNDRKVYFDHADCYKSLFIIPNGALQVWVMYYLQLNKVKKINC